MKSDNQTSFCINTINDLKDLQRFSQIIIMGVHIEGNKLVIIIEPKTFYFDLPKNIDNLKHEIDFVIKQWIFSWVYKKIRD